MNSLVFSSLITTVWYTVLAAYSMAEEIRKTHIPARAQPDQNIPARIRSGPLPISTRISPTKCVMAEPGSRMRKVIVAGVTPYLIRPDDPRVPTVPFMTTPPVKERPAEFLAFAYVVFKTTCTCLK